MATNQASFAHPELMLSLLVPDDWAVEQVAPNQIRFYAPAVPDLDDYQPTMSFTLGEPEGTGAAWFEEFVTRARNQLEAGYEGFRLLGTDLYTNSSFADVAVTTYEWEPQPGMAFAQLQALLAVDATRMYLVNAATRVELADRYLPVFEQVLRDLRVLPPR
jgi:hypothetical protein